jgi:transposase-like protein
LIEKEPVSDICDRHDLNPNVFYRWQKQFFENGAAAFANDRKDRHSKTLEHKISKLKTKLASKDEVIAEIMASHVRLKKNLGEV